MKVVQVLRNGHNIGLMLGDEPCEEAQFGIGVGIGNVDLPGNSFIVEQVENCQDAGYLIGGLVGVAGGSGSYQIHSIWLGFYRCGRKPTV